MCFKHIYYLLRYFDYSRFVFVVVSATVHCVKYITENDDIVESIVCHFKYSCNNQQPIFNLQWSHSIEYYMIFTTIMLNTIHTSETRSRYWLFNKNKLIDKIMKKKQNSNSNSNSNSSSNSSSNKKFNSNTNTNKNSTSMFVLFECISFILSCLRN